MESFTGESNINIHNNRNIPVLFRLAKLKEGCKEHLPLLHPDTDIPHKEKLQLLSNGYY